MKALRILKCSDDDLWYQFLVGTVVTYLGEDEDVYWSDHPSWHRDIVHKEDAELLGEEEIISLMQNTNGDSE